MTHGALDYLEERIKLYEGTIKLFEEEIFTLAVERDEARCLANIAAEKLAECSLKLTRIVEEKRRPCQCEIGGES